MKQGWLSPEIAAKRDLEKEAARRCAEPAAASTGKPIAADPATLQRARYAAYTMGLRFGTAAVASSASTPQQRDLIATVLREVQSEAAALGVPAPELPAIQHMATVLVEFSDSLDADRQCTAARLASRYSPAHGNAYKLGSVVGFSVPLCVNGPCTAYAVQIRRYGQGAGVPERVWLPLAQGSLSSVPGANAREKTFRVLADLDEHFRTGR
jgi:uncharacterized protein YchJ